VFPVALGAGQRLFGEGGTPLKLSLVGADSYESGIAHLSYRPAA
jgi:hypothetical protein